jgi:hypothetical protein
MQRGRWCRAVGALKQNSSDLALPAEAGFAKAGAPHVQRRSAVAGLYFTRRREDAEVGGFGLSALGVLAGRLNFERWTPCQAGKSPIIGLPGTRGAGGRSALSNPSDLPSPAEAGFAKAGAPHAQRERSHPAARRGGEAAARPEGNTSSRTERVPFENSPIKAIVFCVSPPPRQGGGQAPSRRYYEDAIVKRDRGFSGDLIHDVKYRPPFPQPRSRAIAAIAGGYSIGTNNEHVKPLAISRSR